MIEDTHDAELKAAVLRELRLDPRINETGIGVAVVHGVVTLTGRVDTEAEHKAAGQAVHRVEGVLDVANDLMVHVSFALGRNDTDLAEAVRAALERRAAAAAATVHCTVVDAVVTLTGEVDSLGDAEAAAQTVREVAGVRRVDDRLVVREPVVDVFALHRSIEKALARRARREADRIDLSAERGVVTLHGQVDSDADKAAILDLVRHTPGVRDVEDRLRVVR
jgi:osmotically-inducible protein OsmY